jgi:hypothetical protein
LHLRTENKTIPFDHLVEAAGFHRHVVERGSNAARGSRRMALSLFTAMALGCPRSQATVR